MQPTFSQMSNKVPRCTKTTEDSTQKPSEIGRSNPLRQPSPMDTSSRPLLKQLISQASSQMRIPNRLNDASNRLAQEKSPGPSADVAENYDSNDDMDDCDEQMAVSKLSQANGVSRPPNNSCEIVNVFKKTPQSSSQLQSFLLPCKQQVIRPDLRPPSAKMETKPPATHKSPLLSDVAHEQFFAGSFAAKPRQNILQTPQAKPSNNASTMSVPNQIKPPQNGFTRTTMPKQQIGPSNFKGLDRTPLMPHQMIMDFDRHNRRSPTMTAGGQQTNMFTTQQDECLENSFDEDQVDETPQDTVYDQDEFDQSLLKEDVQDEGIHHEADLKQSASRSAAGRQIMPNSQVQMPFRDERMQAISPLRQVYNRLVNQSPNSMLPSKVGLVTNPSVNLTHSLQHSVSGASNQVRMSELRSKSRTSQVSNPPTPAISDQKALKKTYNETVEDESSPLKDQSREMEQKKLEESLNAKQQLIHHRMMALGGQPTISANIVKELQGLEAKSQATEETPIHFQRQRSSKQFELLNPHQLPSTENLKGRSMTQITSQPNQRIANKNLSASNTNLAKPNGLQTQSNSFIQDNLEKQKNEQLKREYLALLAVESQLKTMQKKGSMFGTNKHMIKSRSSSIEVSKTVPAARERQNLADESFGHVVEKMEQMGSGSIRKRHGSRDQYFEASVSLKDSRKLNRRSANEEFMLQQFEQNKLKVTRSPQNQTQGLRPNQSLTFQDAHAIDAVKMKNSRTFVQNFVADETTTGKQSKQSSFLKMAGNEIEQERRSHAKRNKLHSDMQSERSSSKFHLPKQQDQGHASIAAYTAKVKKAFTHKGSPTHTKSIGKNYKHDLIEIAAKNSAITSPKIISQTNEMPQLTRNRAGAVSVKESFNTEVTKKRQGNKRKTIPVKKNIDEFLSRSNSENSEYDDTLQDDDSQEPSHTETASERKGSDSSDYLADDQTETRKKSARYDRNRSSKKRRHSESSVDSRRNILSNEDRRHKKRMSYVRGGRRKTPNQKSRRSQSKSNKRIEQSYSDEEESSDVDSSSHDKSQKSKRHRRTRESRKGEKNKNYEIKTKQGGGYRNQGLKININMKGLDGGQSTEKVYPRQDDYSELQNKQLQLMYGHMMPPNAYALPMFAQNPANPNYAAAMHLQQLNLLTLQQQNLLRIQQPQAPTTFVNGQIIPKSQLGDSSDFKQTHEVPELRMNWSHQEEVRSDIAWPTHREDNKAVVPKTERRERPPTKSDGRIDWPHADNKTNNQPTERINRQTDRHEKRSPEINWLSNQIEDEEGEKDEDENENKSETKINWLHVRDDEEETMHNKQHDAQIVNASVRQQKQPGEQGSGGSELNADKTAEFFPQITFNEKPKAAEKPNNIPDQRTNEKASAEAKQKNTALVICFDDNADQEALRNPFAKKPRLRGKGSGTPGVKQSAPQEVPIKEQVINEQPKDQIKEFLTPIDDSKPQQPVMSAAQPTVNKNKEDLRIEIFFGDENAKATSSKTPNSIAEAFLAKRKIPAQVDQDSAAMSQQAKDTNKEPSVPPKQKQEKQVKTKEELAELRKQMMKKRKTAASVQGEANHNQFENPYGITLTENVANTASKKDNLNYALMHRLAAGAKVKVDRQEMKRLTKKNFEELPENKKKRDEERKRKEAAERQEKIRQYKRDFDDRRKANLKKKQKVSLVESEQSASKNEYLAVETQQFQQIRAAADEYTTGNINLTKKPGQSKY